MVYYVSVDLKDDVISNKGSDINGQHDMMIIIDYI